MAVMLSQPIPPELATSVAMILSKIDSRQSLMFLYELEVLKYSLTKVTHSCEVRQSQIPSQAMIK